MGFQRRLHAVRSHLAAPSSGAEVAPRDRVHLSTRDNNTVLVPRAFTPDEDPRGADGLSVTPEQIEFFKTHGFLIKRQLLDPTALAPFVDQFWQKVEISTGCVRRDDPGSYVDAGERWPCDGTEGRPAKNHTNGGICLGGPGPGSGGNLHWDCSHLPGFLEATSASPAALHVVEALIGGPVKIPHRCRGLYTIFPGARTEEQQEEATLGPHNDQETEQLLSTALLGDVDHHDGNFIVWPGSRKHGHTQTTSCL